MQKPRSREFIYHFKKYQPLSLRLWHWANALAILGLLATVLIRKTLLSWRTNSVVIEEKLRAAGTVITPDLAKDIAVTIRNPLWDWHNVLGFALGFLLVGRILIALFVEKRCPIISSIKGALGLKTVPSSEKGNARHVVLVRLLYAIFYFATFLMVITGVLLFFKTDMSLSKELVKQLKEFHEISMWFFVAFVVSHLLGVVWIECSKAKGVVSDMINGGDRR